MDGRSKIGGRLTTDYRAFRSIDRSIPRDWRQADGIPLFPIYTGIQREDVSVNGLGVYFHAI